MAASGVIALGATLYWVWKKFIDVDDDEEELKSAVGVRGIKLLSGDEITDVFYLSMGDNPVCKVKGRNVEVNKIKLTKRDSKGTKLRG